MERLCAKFAQYTVYTLGGWHCNPLKVWASDAQSRTVENEWRMQECPPTVDSLAKAVGEFVLCKCQPGRGIIFINSKYSDQVS